MYHKIGSDVVTYFYLFSYSHIITLNFFDKIDQECIKMKMKNQYISDEMGDTIS